jgi:hypothetical protein
LGKEEKEGMKRERGKNGEEEEEEVGRKERERKTGGAGQIEWAR